MIKKSENSNGAGGTKNKIVQTYAEDIAEVLKHDKGGLIKKIIRGEAEHEKEKRNLSPESRKNQLFMFIGALLILTSLAILVFFLFQEDDSTVSIEKQFVPIVFIDKSVFIEVNDLTKERIIQTIVNKVRTTEVKNKGVEGIYLTLNKKVIGLRGFITLIRANFEPIENSSLGDVFVSDSFLLGVVKSGAEISPPVNKDFFILLKMRSVPDIFESLRDWENNMFFDLYKFFGIELSSETKYLLTKDFENSIVENKNARILYEGNEEQALVADSQPRDRKIVMMYIFTDDNSVIITDTKDVVREIILRLASSEVKK